MGRGACHVAVWCRAAGSDAAAEYHRHHGRRYRLGQYRRLQPRRHGRQDAQSRQAGQRGHALHRLLRRGKLHGGPGELHHRRAADPHRPDDGRPGGLAAGHSRPRRSRSRRRSSAWATPPASSARTISAISTSSCRRCTASTNSSAISTTWTRWRIRRIATTRRRSRTSSARATWSTLGDRSRRSDRTAALGQDRQAADRGRRDALSQADGDGRRRDPRLHAEVHRQGAH